MTALNLTGYASVTETPYAVGPFMETIARGAFKRSLANRPDLPLLVNHSGLPIARTRSGTMSLVEDDRGLRVDAVLDTDDLDVASLAPKLKRGDVTSMSFAFRAVEQEWSSDRSQRRVTQAELSGGDISVVTFPSNAATSVGLRHASGGGLEQRERAAQLVGQRVVTIGVITSVDGHEIRSERSVSCARCEDRGTVTIPCPNCSPAPKTGRASMPRRSAKSEAVQRQLAELRTYQLRRELERLKNGLR